MSYLCDESYCEIYSMFGPGSFPYDSWYWSCCELVHRRHESNRCRSIRSVQQFSILTNQNLVKRYPTGTAGGESINQFVIYLSKIVCNPSIFSGGSSFPKKILYALWILSTRLFSSVGDISSFVMSVLHVNIV